MWSGSGKGSNTTNYRLRVTAGPEYHPSTHRIVPVNSDKTLRFENSHAIVNVCVRIQEYTGLPNNSPKTSRYFSHKLHQNDQYSICFALIPKHTVSGDDLVFGNDFDRPVRDRLPPGFNTAFRIVKWTIDPALDGDPYADKPYLYSPGLVSWNYFRIGDKVDPTKTDKVLNLHSDVVEEGADGSGKEVRKSFQIPNDPGQRRKYFLDEDNRRRFQFEEGRIYLIDFGNPYLGFNDFSLRLPGFHLQVAKYIDEKNHKLRYTLKNRRTGDVYFVVLLTLLIHDSKEEVSERTTGGVAITDGHYRHTDGKEGKFDWESDPDNND
ncbi:hypothetical protein VTN77DRAFT_4509 [Rasamsonia byssochlamydoides]|uniref:uncharacterized protein n=1 Tax=Rasamsonia byssochlamydoides TaxID=89139 RepID=UPI0037429937